MTQNNGWGPEPQGPHPLSEGAWTPETIFVQAQPPRCNPDSDALQPLGHQGGRDWGRCSVEMSWLLRPEDKVLHDISEAALEWYKKCRWLLQKLWRQQPSNFPNWVDTRWSGKGGGKGGLILDLPGSMEALTTKHIRFMLYALTRGCEDKPRFAIRFGNVRGANGEISRQPVQIGMLLGHKCEGAGNAVGQIFGRRRIEAHNMRVLYHSTERRHLDDIFAEGLKLSLIHI